MKYDTEMRQKCIKRAVAKANEWACGCLWVDNNKQNSLTSPSNIAEEQPIPFSVKVRKQHVTHTLLILGFEIFTPSKKESEKSLRTKK